MADTEVEVADMSKSCQFLERLMFRTAQRHMRTGPKRQVLRSSVYHSKVFSNNLRSRHLMAFIQLRFTVETSQI